MAQLSRTLFLLAVSGFLAVSSIGPVAASTASMCDRAARSAAETSDVPFDVLLAITRTETGRHREGRMQPWPWTVNMEGLGKWFDTEEDARAYVAQHFQRGARSFDVGCFQINYKWHGSAFRSLDEMFDPNANARYAAAFLTQLHAELGSWTEAAGAYHSRTPKYAERYKARFREIRAALPNATPQGALPSSDTRRAILRVNTYPLLQPGIGGGRMGSLMPTSAASARSLFAKDEG